MGRVYVPSTPVTRGEVDPDEQAASEVAALSPEDLSPQERLAAIEEAAAGLGYKLVPIEAEVEEPDEEPAGNASRDEWADYARSQGATDEDLVDEDSKDLGRDALREKYGTPAS